MLKDHDRDKSGDIAWFRHLFTSSGNCPLKEVLPDHHFPYGVVTVPVMATRLNYLYLIATHQENGYANPLTRDCCSPSAPFSFYFVSPSCLC